MNAFMYCMNASFICCQGCQLCLQLHIISAEREIMVQLARLETSDNFAAQLQCQGFQEEKKKYSYIVYLMMICAPRRLHSYLLTVFLMPPKNALAKRLPAPSAEALIEILSLLLYTNTQESPQ